MADPTMDESQSLSQMRKSYKLAAVSHFVGLYSHHLDFKHNVQELEQDLLPSHASQETYLPYLLGKLLNTLSNDRNTNHTNWLNALRRSYNRRVSMRQDNPFYQYLIVPDAVVRKELEAERLKAIKGEEEDGEGMDEERKKGILLESEEKLRAAEGKKPLKQSSSYIKPEESSSADIDMGGATAEAQIPLQENAVNDGFNAEMADTIARDAAQAGVTDQLEGEMVKKEEENGAAGAGGEGEEQFWEEQRAVEWKDLSLETKIDAIYNVCEWHMVDPDKQFRKYLQFDGESAWQRLEPIGLDSSQNYYYHLSDDRLWIQRPVPSLEQAREMGCPEMEEPIKKPKNLLGLRAGPRDKSKKGTVTGTVRFKLMRDPKTGEFKQVKEEENIVGRKTKEEDGEFTLDGQGQGGEVSKPEGQKLVEEEDGEDLFAELEDSSRQKKLEERNQQNELKKEEEARELTEWEREIWAERWRAENTPGFNEWEAVCVDLNDWRELEKRFEGSVDEGERNLRQYIVDWIPEYEKLLAERAKSLEEEQAAAASRQAAARTIRDSTMDTVARLAAEEAALAERFTRVTRGQLSHLDDNNGSPSSSSSKQLPPGESREDRLKKREEEKRARTELEEQRMLDQVREQEREEARMRNGGVLPYEMMNDQEKANYEFEQEKEQKRLQKEAEKKKREDIKRQRAKERRAELKAEKEAADAELAEFEAEINPHQEPVYAAPVQQYHQPQPGLPIPNPLAEEPPWYTDCEVCGRQGWNIDDGVETICCEQCEEWQHLPCHIQRDALEGRQPVNYSDDAYKFYCIRCQQQPGRLPRPVPPAHELPPPPPPILVPPPAPVMPVPPVAGQKRKAQPKSQPAPKKPKPQKASPSNGSYGTPHHPLYHPSAYANVPSPQPSPPQPQPVQPQPQPAAAAAAAAQPQMTYEELSNRVQQDPRLLAQLPPAYQQHFSEKFGIPLPQ
ncbi:uncharacterized protein JCM6883_002393 [Sporobolomyces salmoneus]|uniref:uncharacterized protein n=1 Tax=Sporobolomyces salmoneus TaxID=183962 RepID=UPI003177BC3E